MATVGVICGLVIAMAVFAAAVFFAVPTVEQILAQGYTTTTGTITHSNIQRGRGSLRHLAMSSADIAYTYRVAGKDYSSNRYRYGWLYSTSWGGTTEAIVADLPVGKNVTVYYAPHDPSNAILQPGIGGSDLLMATGELLWIFCAVGLSLLIARSALGPRPRPMVGGHKIWDDGFKTRIRLADSAWKAAWGTILACDICCGMGIVKLFGTNPPLKVALAGWGIILGAGIVVFLWKSVRVAGGRLDLVMVAGQSIKLPRAFGRREDVEVRWENATVVEVDKAKKRGGRGGHHYIYYAVLVVSERGGTPRREKLREFSDGIRAIELVAWLRERLQIEVQNQPGGRSP